LSEKICNQHFAFDHGLLGLLGITPVPTF